MRGGKLDRGGINFVEITPEDHIFIENIYKQIIKKYVRIIKSGNGNSAPGIEIMPTFQDAVKFLIEHAIFNEKDMENFAARLAKNRE